MDLTEAFNNQLVVVHCPECTLSLRVKVKDIINESHKICRGCHLVIRLADKNKSGNRGIRMVNDALDDLMS